MEKKFTTFHIETFGCQMNKGDSELIALSLSACGFTETATEDADILVFNTCSVRQHAEDRAAARISGARSASRNSIIVLAGCMAQRIGNELLGQGLVDIVIGPYESPKTGNIIEEYLSGSNGRIFNSQSEKDFISRIDMGLAGRKDEYPWHKWVTITHGCENFCSYCIVPYVRGKLISFTSAEIIEYAKKLAANGIKEITLLGQNVNQYGERGDIPFHSLLAKVSAISGFERVNFLTSHPKDFSEDIINVIRDNGNISRSIHLPLQSGSDTVLKLMNRKYTAGHYRNIIEKIHNTLGTYSVSTDIIVGFPGESRKDFEDTLNMIKGIKFDDAFMYAYSPREGTAAFNLEETIPREEKMGRLRELIDLQRKISQEKLLSRVNCLEDIIVERISKKSADEVMGKTFLNHPAVISGIPEDIGRKIRVMITGLRGNTLYGKRIA